MSSDEAVDEAAGGVGGEGGGSDGGGGEGSDGSSGNDDGGGGEGANRVTWTWTSMTNGMAGGSSMVTPKTLLIASRAFAWKATAADPTWLAPPEVSVATTKRNTLPAVRPSSPSSLEQAVTTLPIASLHATDTVACWAV